MSDTVSVRATVTYKCWQAPNFAHVDMPPRPKQDGVHALPSIPINELEPEALDALAAAWLDHLYAKAERKSPWAKP